VILLNQQLSDSFAKVSKDYREIGRWGNELRTETNRLHDLLISPEDNPANLSLIEDSRQRTSSLLAQMQETVLLHLQDDQASMKAVTEATRILLEAPTMPSREQGSNIKRYDWATDQIDKHITPIEAATDELIISRSQGFEKRIRQANMVLLIALIAFAIMLFLVAWSVSTRLLRPMDTIRHAIEGITKGSYQKLPEFKLYYELEILMRRFNHMVEQLQFYRQNTDRKLIRKTEQYRILLERSPNAIFFVDQDFRITFQNPIAELLFKGNKDKCLPENLLGLVRKAADEKTVLVSRKLHDAIQLKLEGEEHHFLPHVFPMDPFLEQSDEITQEEVEGLAVILQDVSLLYLADSLKTNLMATVSHELKTPLTSARMSLQLLRRKTLGPLTPDQLDLVETAIEDLNRQKNTIHHLLDLARKQDEGEIIPLRPVHLAKLLPEWLAEYRNRFPSATIDAQLSSLDQELEVMADPVRLHIVVDNLIHNALKHTPHSKPVSLKVIVKPHRICFYIDDHGPGIPAGMEDRVFEKFFRAKDSPTGGSGLGLFIAREIVKEHGGDIVCYNRTEGGARFRFWIPRPQDHKQVTLVDQVSADS